MIQQLPTASGRISARRWLALPLSAAFGGLLLVLLFAGLRPGPAVAAGLAEPATAYACTEPGLNAALAAGGSATFTCGSPTTITVSDRKNVPHNLTLDGGNNLILSGGGITGVFTVPAGIHLSLLNLTLRDTGGYSGGAIYNAGLLDVTNAHFISNTAFIGAALYNAPGASATLSGSTVENNVAFASSVWNGDNTVSPTASLAVINSRFTLNQSVEGAAIGNANGPVTITGSSFLMNAAAVGGAILNNSTLHVENSAFDANRADVVILAAGLAGRPRPGLPSRATSIANNGGGAIYITTVGDTIIAGSAFTDNFSLAGGGAVMFGELPSGPITPTGASLTVVGSTFVENCTGGPGGALSSLLPASISDSSFSFNFADSGANACVTWAAGLSARPGFQAPALANTPAVSVPTYLAGAGGAVFSAYNLAVTNTSFLSNTATVTPTGGGGAIDNYVLGRLSVSNGTFQGNVARHDGGAIFNDGLGQASLVNSSFTGNTAQNDSGGGVFSLGLLSVSGSSFTSNYGAPGLGSFKRGGGAIFQGAPLAAGDLSSPQGPAGNGGAQTRPARPGFLFYGLTVDHSTFVSNSSAFEGGAIDAAPATIVASTFTSNTAAYGGAIDILASDFTVSGSTFIGNAVVDTTRFSASQGGAIDTFNGSVTNINVINSTFFANRASSGATGGAINGDGNTYAITNTTFVSNTAVDSGSGGALSENDNFVLLNTLIAFNVGGNCQVTMTLSSANLEYPGTSCGGASVQADPKILPPANNGGPTLTSALLAGSPAINTGDDTGCPSTDQRGAHRPVGPHCDIGAFEFGGQVPWLWLPVIRK